MPPFSDLSGACQERVHAILQPHTPSSMVWQVLLLESFKTAFVSLLIYCNHFVFTLCPCVGLPLGTYSTKWCLFLEKLYSPYSLWMFPHCLSVASEAPLKTGKGYMQLITSHDKKDHDGKTNNIVWKAGFFIFGLADCKKVAIYG